MKITKVPGLGRFGIFIDDVDFTSMSDEEWLEIGKLQLDNLVTIIRDCNMPWEQQPDWIEKFGPRRSGTRFYMEKKYNQNWNWLYKEALADNPILDELDRYTIKAIAKVQYQTPAGKSFMKVSGARDAEGNALGMFAEGELLWHSNESGTLTFTPGVALLGVQNMIGSSTGFITTTDYYENVSNAFRSELDDMILMHRFIPGAINPGLRQDQDEIVHHNMCPVNDVEIPMTILSPGGIKGLHYSINTAYSIKGMSKEESDKVFETINKDLFVDKFIYDHWYQSDHDLCLFDNSITLHRRLGDIKERVCHRVPHDYTKIHENFWQPYSQPDVAKQYEDEMLHYIDLCKVKGYRMLDGSLS
jgi:alpha-ketoglutarate-dependent taurine dioxygenase